MNNQPYYAYRGYGPVQGPGQQGNTRIDPSSMPGGFKSAMLELLRNGQISIDEFMQRMKPKPKAGAQGVMPWQYTSPYQRAMTNSMTPNYAQNIPGYNPDPQVRGDSYSRAAWQAYLHRQQQSAGLLGRGAYGNVMRGAGPNA